MSVRLTTQQRAVLGVELRVRYEAGASINDLVRETGRSYGSVHQLLADAGTVFRSRGGARGGRR